MLSSESWGVLGAAERRVSLTDFRWVFIWGSTAAERNRQNKLNKGRKGSRGRCRLEMVEVSMGTRDRMRVNRL